jgi:hypothetical protein
MTFNDPHPRDAVLFLLPPFYSSSQDSHIVELDIINQLFLGTGWAQCLCSRAYPGGLCWERPSGLEVYYVGKK